MNSFARGIIVGSMVGATIGALGANNNVWMRKNVIKPSRRAMRRASRVMNDVAGML
jgi:hypothetical protein